MPSNILTRYTDPTLKVCATQKTSWSRDSQANKYKRIHHNNLSANKTIASNSITHSSCSKTIWKNRFWIIHSLWKNKMVSLLWILSWTDLYWMMNIKVFDCQRDWLKWLNQMYLVVASLINHFSMPSENGDPF